tara:strand:- start:351 stop:860 length:510 start_codon:yes stop_codon:yes gene_type:complete
MVGFVITTSGSTRKMMELSPTLVSGGVVLDATRMCSHLALDCKACLELSVGVHNWLVATGLEYVMIDFEDEKDVCQAILIELLQLRKRLKIPFIFVGLMDKPKSILTSYAYSGYPFFSTPEEGIHHLRQMHPELVDGVSLAKVVFNVPIPCSRSRQNKLEVREGGAEAQ